MHELLHSLQQEFGVTSVMAAEIECYVLLADDLPETIDAFWQPVDAALRDVGVGLIRIEAERGDHQYELVTTITSPERLAEWLSNIRSIITAQAEMMGVRVTFDAKAFEDQPSSGLHLHLHLADAEGNNLYHKTADWTSDALRWSLGGLLADLPRVMPIFCPGDYSMYRFDDADHVPKVAGWGVNNRYCALRIPMENDPYHKRIEHRVPGADAEPYAAIAAMLEGVMLGLRNRIEPPAQEYGKPTIGLVQSLAAAAASEATDEITDGA